ncbi:MAG: hypothetical protein EA424_11470 [Planctomycetaceae bacterium]|nr:MAG: hypothetical protein EA424_11470 [Planctomycetaceae bacterium]
MERVTVFDYPTTAHVRQHGPFGYRNYESYRDWLRDEFRFRCVYCLKRETWGEQRAAFHLDHFVPQVHDPTKALEYDNLVYVCASCNALKADLLVPDPCRIAYGRSLRVNDDGTIEALNKEGERLVDKLRLDSPDRTSYRRQILETLRSFIRHDERALLVRWTRYPEDLPDLRRKQEPGNRRPEGREHCCFAQREAGKLPKTY